jgi:hypothetical protein
MSVWEDVKWRDEMIRELREALKFYADEKHYKVLVLVDQQRGFLRRPKARSNASSTRFRTTRPP